MRGTIISKEAADPVAHAALCPDYTHLLKCCPQPALLMLVLPCKWAQQTLSSSRPNAWAAQDLFAYFRIRDIKSPSARVVHCWLFLPHPCCIRTTKLSVGPILCNIFPFCGVSVVQVCCKTWCQVLEKQKLLQNHFHSFVAKKVELTTQPENSVPAGPTACSHAVPHFFVASSCCFQETSLDCLTVSDAHLLCFLIYILLRFNISHQPYTASHALLLL